MRSQNQKKRRTEEVHA